MATEVSIKILGDQMFRRKIRGMERRAVDMKPVMNKIGNKIQHVIEEQFATQGVRGGRKWNPLEFDTISRRGSAEPILVHTADMLIEMTDEQNFHARHDGLTVTIPRNIQTKAESAQYGFHVANQYGYAGKFVKPRPIVQLTMIDRAEIKRDITNWLVHGWL